MSSNTRWFIILMMYGTGGILVYSGIKDVHPLDLLRSVFTGKPAPSASTPVAPVVTSGVDSVLKNWNNLLAQQRQQTQSQRKVNKPI